MKDEFDTYAEHFRRNVLPKMDESEVFLSIGSGTDDFDVKQATEIGAALILGKPMLLLVPRGRTVSASLRRAADVIIDDWNGGDPDAKAIVESALRRLAEHDR